MSALNKSVLATRRLDPYKYDAVTETTELMWRCGLCGKLIHRNEGLPEKCPSCGAAKREFALVNED